MVVRLTFSAENNGLQSAAKVLKGGVLVIMGDNGTGIAATTHSVRPPGHILQEERTMSIERDHEIERLAVADRHVAEAQKHIAEQLARVEHMGGDDADVASAEGLFATLNGMLMEWQTQRDLIVKRLTEIDAKDGRSN